MILNPYMISKLLVKTITDGGATVNIEAPDTYENVTDDRWAVALGKEHEASMKTIEALRHPLDFKAVVEGVAGQVKQLNDDFKAVTGQSVNLYAVGTWISNDALIVEPVQLVTDTYEALTLAIERNQSSIYHLTRQEYVSIDDLKELLKGGK